MWETQLRNADQTKYLAPTKLVQCVNVLRRFKGPILNQFQELFIKNKKGGQKKKNTQAYQKLAATFLEKIETHFQTKQKPLNTNLQIYSCEY